MSPAKEMDKFKGRCIIAPKAIEKNFLSAKPEKDCRLCALFVEHKVPYVRYWPDGRKYSNGRVQEVKFSCFKGGNIFLKAKNSTVQ